MSEPGTPLKSEFSTRPGDALEVAELAAKTAEPDSPLGTHPNARDDGPPPPLVGKVLSDRYKIVRCLGAGAMGEVYEAHHVHMKKAVAVKVLLPDMMAETEIVERFKREAQAAAHIEHPNVCAATDFGETETGAFFMVMEYLEGRPLDEVLKEENFLEPERALHVIHQITQALERSHELGIIHRDLKPANIMLIQRGDDPDFVKVLDFGVAQVYLDGEGDKEDSTQLTQAGLIYGTLTYMPPEQAMGAEIDARSDLYAIGCILYELLTGRPPFISSAPMKLASMHMTREPPPFSEIASERNIGRDLEKLVMKLLAKTPEKRHQNASELLRALERLQPSLADPGNSVMALPAPSSVPSQSQVVLVLAMGGVIVLLVGLVVLLVFVGGDDEEESSGGPPLAAELAGEVTQKLEIPSAFDEPMRLIRSEDGKGALEVLKAMPEEQKQTAFYHLVTGHAQATRKKWKQAFTAYEQAIALEPRLAEDAQLLDYATDNFDGNSKKAAAYAITFFEDHRNPASRMRLVQTASSSKWRNARQRALNVLESSGQIDELDEWEELSIALRKADDKCKERRPLVVRLGEIGNPGALPVLEYWSGKDCGIIGSDDCMGCVREELDVIITELKAKQSD